MPLTLFDTMTREPMPVVPREAGHVRLYTCGPTVWNRAHIGNFRTFCVEDMLRRVLEQRFDRVTHVMNLTDVDDRILANARAAGRTLEAETAPWIAAFFEDLDTLGIRRAHHYPRATAYVDAMVELIGRLTESGATYTSDGSVYFRIGAFPAYGRLSGLDPSSLRAGAGGRVDADDYTKEDVRDFALWKAVPADEIGWDSGLGRGHPGWHIECSAMAMALLGESIDIHCGGVDNIFPHHENEIAQSEGATGTRFARQWFHVNHLNIDDEKMSKRLGNYRFVPDITDAHAASALRLLLVGAAHYRRPVSFSWEMLDSTQRQVEGLALFRDRLFGATPRRGADDPLPVIAREAVAAVDAAIDDDLNVPLALGELSRAMREVNRILDAGAATRAGLDAALALVARLDDVLGVLPLVDREREAALTDTARTTLAERAAARDERDWARSDRLRDALRDMGIAVDDTPAGQRWRPAG